ncbi:MAG: 3-oxoacyl-ACP synthase III family protein [Sphingobacterium sp.]
MNIKIIGSGSFIPELVIKNDYFLNRSFHDSSGKVLPDTENIIKKFKDITGIEERRYVEDGFVTSDMAAAAARKAIEHAAIDSESIDYIILAHNYGDILEGSIQSDTVPSIAARVKHKLGIKNPKCVAYDLLFGCPGWVEGMIQANAFIKAGMANRCLVIGAETLSRVTDPHDRDSMIYADGAGAVIVEQSSNDVGLLAFESATYSLIETSYLNFGPSFNTERNDDHRYIKMKGRKIYEFALTNVPLALKQCLEKAEVDISEISKILIHQANEKMDIAIIERFFKLYDLTPPDNIMPMTIGTLGNSSVATVPTLYDLINRGMLDNHTFNSGNILLFASVGAGMNINAFIYRV